MIEKLESLLILIGLFTIYVFATAITRNALGEMAALISEDPYFGHPRVVPLAYALVSFTVGGVISGRVAWSLERKSRPWHLQTRDWA